MARLIYTIDKVADYIRNTEKESTINISIKLSMEACGETKDLDITVYRIEDFRFVDTLLLESQENSPNIITYDRTLWLQYLQNISNMLKGVLE